MDILRLIYVDDSIAVYLCVEPGRHDGPAEGARDAVDQALPLAGGRQLAGGRRVVAVRLALAPHHGAGGPGVLRHWKQTTHYNNTYIYFARGVSGLK